MTPPDELPEIHWPGRVLDARLQLLDRLIHDIHEVPLGTVDDIMLDGLPVGQDIPRDAPPPVVTGRDC